MILMAGGWHSRLTEVLERNREAIQTIIAGGDAVIR